MTDRFVAAGFDVTALGGDHAQIYPGLLPGPPNNAYLIDGSILHPGDSMPPPPDATAVTALLLPVAAPWLQLAEAIDYARGFSGATVLPIHDGFLTAPGKQLTDTVLSGVLGAGVCLRPADGDVVAA